MRQEGYLFAIVAGLLMVMVSATVWASISIATGLRIGYMSLAVGFAMAFVVRYCTDQQDQITGVIAAIFALMGSVLGNFLTVCTIASRDFQLPLTTVILHTLPRFGDVVTKSTRPIDVVLYGLAAYCGFKYGQRPLKAKSAASAKG